MLQIIENFLSDEECDYFIELIEKNNYPSSVSGQGKERSTYSNEHRTSSTSSFDSSDEKVSALKARIANINGYDVEKGEDLQGQRYEPGQYFRPHFDWFEGDSYTNHCLASGNRVKTFMIYLNDDFEGGSTNFPELKRNIQPKKGSAVVWDNMKDGEVQRDVLHEGVEVTSGKKYIITSWWRENVWDGVLDSEMARKVHETPKPKMRVVGNGKTFSSYEDLPKLHHHGFEKVKVPDDAWNLIMELYEDVRSLEREEHYPGKDKTIPHESGGLSSTLMDLGMYAEKRDMLHHMLRPMHEQFCGQNIEPTFIYGIRSYLRGAGLVKHRDRIETHHISSIIMVDKNLACGCKVKPNADDWPLDIQDHFGEWHKVYLEPGEMVLYESAVCEHGREELFGGTYFRNFFVHYKLKDLEYVRP